MSRTYVKVEDIFSPGITQPHLGDSIAISYRGIHIDVFGILHGIYGGTNKEYTRFIQRTINSSPNPVLSEKNMKKVYSGIETEVDDWLAIPTHDAAGLSMALTMTPSALLSAGRSLISGLFKSRDSFDVASQNLIDLDGSPFFHLIDPWERRRLSGFPDPETYLKINLGRRLLGEKHQPPLITAPNWRWLTMLEPYANLPCRSIHMLEFAAEYAIQKGYRRVSLFVGELHSTDMAWFSTSSLDGFATHYEKTEIETIQHIARQQAQLRASGNRGHSKRFYLAGIAAGTVPFHLSIATIAASANILSMII